MTWSSRLTDFTAKTPFQLEDVGAAAKMLLSFGVAGDDIIDRLQVLGDIAAGANVPLQDMAAIYGKTLSEREGADRGAESDVRARRPDHSGAGRSA